MGDWSCGKTIILSAILVLIACTVALFVVGFKVALPYQKTRQFSQRTTSCSLERVEMGGPVVCDCSTDEDDCYSEYPCVQVFVNYRETGSGKFVVNASIYQSAYDYTALKHVECFARECTSSERLNKLKVLEAVQALGNVKDDFPCHPDLDSKFEVLLHVIPQWHVLLGMLLPASPLVLAVLGALVCFVMVQRS